MAKDSWEELQNQHAIEELAGWLVPDYREMGMSPANVMYLSGIRAVRAQVLDPATVRLARHFEGVDAEASDERLEESAAKLANTVLTLAGYQEPKN